MIGEKTKSALAVAAAVSVGFLLLGLTYAIFPNKGSTDFRVIGIIQMTNQTGWQTAPPSPTPNSFNQATSAFYWIGIAIAIAAVAALTVLLVNRVKTKKATANGNMA